MPDLTPSVHPPSFDHFFFRSTGAAAATRPSAHDVDPGSRCVPAEPVPPGDTRAGLRHRLGRLLRRLANAGVDSAVNPAGSLTVGGGGVPEDGGGQDRPGSGRPTTLDPGGIPDSRGGPGEYILTAPRSAGAVGPSSEGDLLRGLEASFSMDTYLQATHGDRMQALRLYTWNTNISAALYPPLQGIELALRHAMDRELSACYGEDWYDDPAAGLDFRSRERVASAKRAVAPNGQTVAPSRVVEKLCFGFWTSLLSSGCRIDQFSDRKANHARTLWKPALRRAFPHRTFLTRRQAQSAFDRLRRLRNKVAHHEPIFERPLWEDYVHILTVTGWISSEARLWIEQNSRVPWLLATRNDTSDVDPRVIQGLPPGVYSCTNLEGALTRAGRRVEV